MANVMGLKSLMNKPRRNGFDLSRKNAFTAKVGELLPIVTLECIPGDNIKISNKWFSRTMPVNSAAFTRLREYYDVYFVPYTVLWSRFDDFIAQTDSSNHACSINQSDNLGSMHPYFTVNDVGHYLENMESGSSPQNIFGLGRRECSCKLLDYLGYGDFTKVTGTNYVDLPADANLNLNAFPLLAYQKIYNDFYRDQQWERPSTWSFNVDYLHGNTSNDMHIPVSQIDVNEPTDCMFDLRYCSWNKDYFTGLLPSPQFGDEAIASPLIGDLAIGGSGNITFSNAPQQGTNTVSNALLTLDNSVPDINTAGLSVLALRQAEFLQKWKEITQSGKQDYKSQMKKHFGVDVPSGMSHLCEYVGGWSSDLNINEVVNQNLASEGSDAQVFGKGVGDGTGHVSYNCREHGILMVIYHATPLLDYANTGIKKFNQKVFATDYAIPEFDQLGMQVVRLSEFAYWGNAKTSQVIYPASILKPATPMGYAPRYVDYKTAYDEIHGSFVDSMSYWVAPISMDYIVRYAQQVVGDKNFLSWPFLKVNPAVLDSIFVQNVDSSSNTDQLLCNSYFDIKAVRNLDYNGLPY